MRQQEVVVDASAPVHEPTFIRRLPERRDRGAHQQELRGRHLRMRRHFQRAELHQAKPPGRGLRRIELVDAELGAMRVPCHVRQQMAEHPINQPGCHLLARPDLRERDLQFRQSCPAAPRRCADAGSTGPMNSPLNR